MQVTNALYFHALYVRMPELCNKYNTPHLQDMLLSLKVKKAERRKIFVAPDLLVTKVQLAASEELCSTFLWMIPVLCIATNDSQ